MIYKRIRDLREDSDLKQYQLLKNLNIAQRTYSHYENGDRTIPPEIFSKLADYYHTSVDYLMGRTDVKEPYPKTNNKDERT
jgi:transcriptional regulator with XRE-family HTH domain